MPQTWTKMYTLSYIGIECEALVAGVVPFSSWDDIDVYNARWDEYAAGAYTRSSFSST